MDNSKRNPSHEKTPEEHQREKLRHFPTLLQRWTGGTAKVIELTVSHSLLTLRIEHPDKDGNLQLSLMPPLYYRGPFFWQSCAIDISLYENHVFVISDLKADVEILTEHIEIREDAKPYHRMVVARKV